MNAQRAKGTNAHAACSFSQLWEKPNSVSEQKRRTHDSSSVSALSDAAAFASGVSPRGIESRVYDRLNRHPPATRYSTVVSAFFLVLRKSWPWVVCAHDAGRESDETEAASGQVEKSFPCEWVLSREWRRSR